jgi:hypothetical protein
VVPFNEGPPKIRSRDAVVCQHLLIGDVLKTQLSNRYLGVGHSVVSIVDIVFRL